MARTRVGGVRQAVNQEGVVLTADMGAEETAAVITAVYALLRIRGASPSVAGPEEAAWFEHREVRHPAPSWQTRSLAASWKKGARRA